MSHFFWSAGFPLVSLETPFKSHQVTCLLGCGAFLTLHPSWFPRHLACPFGGLHHTVYLSIIFILSCWHHIHAPRGFETSEFIPLYSHLSCISKAMFQLAIFSHLRHSFHFSPAAVDSCHLWSALTGYVTFVAHTQNKSQV
jgi:hypothetical protein